MEEDAVRDPGVYDASYGLASKGAHVDRDNTVHQTLAMLSELTKSQAALVKQGQLPPTAQEFAQIYFAERKTTQTHVQHYLC